MRSTEDEKQRQIQNLRTYQSRNSDRAERALEQLQRVARDNKNMFAELMDAVRWCSLGEITESLFEVGGQYRRNM